MVITAGLLDNEVWSDESQLAPRPGYDQKEIPRQFTKICWEAREAQSLPLMLRRAFKTGEHGARRTGLLAVSQPALEAKNQQAQILPGERFLFNSRPRPEAAAVEQCAKWLIAAKRPLLVVGDEVWKSARLRNWWHSPTSSDCRWPPASRPTGTTRCATPCTSEISPWERRT